MLKKLTQLKPFQLFVAILLPFLLSIMLVILIQSSFLYNNFEKLVLNMIYNAQKTDLQNIGNSVSDMKQTARALSTQAFFDDTIDNLLYSDIDPMYYTKYSNKLISYKNIYPFLDSIYIFNGKRIYAAPSYDFSNNFSSFYDKEIINILGDMKDYRTHSLIPRKIPYTEYGSTKVDPTKYTYVYSYLFYDSQQQSGKIDEAIILNISSEWLWKSINSSSDKKNSRIFIIDNKGRLITKDPKYSILENLSDKNFIKSIEASNESIGSFKMMVDGVDSFITYASTAVPGWKLISITPYSYVVMDINNMRHKTYSFVFFILIASILIFIYLSRRLYIPINSLVHNFTALEVEKRNDFYYRQQDFLRRLIKNVDSSKIHLCKDWLPTYGITLNLSEKFLIIPIKIDYYSLFCDKFNLEDRGLIKYKIMNIITELLFPVFNNQCVDMNEDMMVIILNYTYNNSPSSNEILVSKIKEIQASIEEHYAISLSFSFSEIFEALEDLNVQYTETGKLFNYRVTLGHKSMFFHDNMSIQPKGFKYPLEKVKLLTDALVLEHIEDAKKIFTDIIQYASKYSYVALTSTLLRLLLSINNAIDVINTNNDFNFNLGDRILKLQSFETLEEVQASFYDMFESILFEMELKKDDKYVDLIEEVSNIIYKEYTDPNLSLKSISDAVHLSSSYLSKLFKQYKLVSIADFINIVRLERAKFLLASTEDSVTTIMNNLGFVSRSHFFTQFKKVYGITPNQYRSDSRKTKTVNISDFS